MIVQNIVSLTGRDKPGEDHLNYTITKEQQPQGYAFYGLIYQSLDYYSMRSLDALQSFQTSITTMLTMKQEQGNTVLQNAPDNQERSALSAITNTKILPQTTTDLGDQTPETTLLSFFKCFEETTGDITIIDATMMKDYFATAQQSNTTTSTVGARKKNAAFTVLRGDISAKISSSDADEDLKKSLNDANIV